MTEKRWSVLAAVSGVFAAYFLLIGLQLRSEPPTPAEDAVGLGLVVLGGGFVLAALICLIGWLDARNPGADVEGPDPGQPPAA